MAHHRNHDQPLEFQEATRLHAAPNISSQELPSSESILQQRVQQVEEDAGSDERSQGINDVMIQAQKHLKERQSVSITAQPHHHRQERVSSLCLMDAEEEGEDVAFDASQVHSHHRQGDNHRRATLSAMANFARRQSSTTNNEEWQKFLRNQEEEGSGRNAANHNELEGVAEECEDDGVEYHHHEHSLGIPWYCRPVQRQRWDDDQVLPHVDWGDLFFDLFYVAAAYNLGGMVISALGNDDWTRGMLYFVAIFGPLYNIWESDFLVTLYIGGLFAPSGLCHEIYLCGICRH